MLIRLTAISLALLTVTLISGCGKQNRYMLAKDKDGIVYRTDRATGETVMFKDGKFREVNREKTKPLLPITKFDDTDYATEHVTGRAGAEGDAVFAGRLYNQNDDVDITSITLRIVHKNDGEDNPRLYKYVCNKTPHPDGTVEGAPQSAWNFSVKILRGDEPKGHAYSWSIHAMEGRFVK